MKYKKQITQPPFRLGLNCIKELYNKSKFDHSLCPNKVHFLRQHLTRNEEGGIAISAIATAATLETVPKEWFREHDGELVVREFVMGSLETHDDVGNIREELTRIVLQ